MMKEPDEDTLGFTCNDSLGKGVAVASTVFLLLPLLLTVGVARLALENIAVSGAA